MHAHSHTINDGGRTLEAYVTTPEHGSGPGILVVADAAGLDATMRAFADLLAADGYTVLLAAIGEQSVAAALASLRALPTCKGKLAAIGFGGGVTVALRAPVDCAIGYGSEALGRSLELAARTTMPIVLHGPADDAADGAPKNVAIYRYADCDRAFYRPSATVAAEPLRRGAVSMAYSRTLALLRRELGPYYDLSALWEFHRACEFVTKDAAATMRTMVAQPYVNHIPTMIGGYGQADLHRFYRDFFIPKLPSDIRNIPVSRTVGADRVVNEGVLCFTHDAEIAWMLPGVAPTGRYVEVALVGIITFRGDKLVHEHIYWDQATVLVQIGLLDPRGLPVAGADAARKVLDPSLPGNALLPGW